MCCGWSVMQWTKGVSGWSKSSKISKIYWARRSYLMLQKKCFLHILWEKKVKLLGRSGRVQLKIVFEQRRLLAVEGNNIRSLVNIPSSILITIGNCNRHLIISFIHLISRTNSDIEIVRCSSATRWVSFSYASHNYKFHAIYPPNRCCFV